MTSESSLAGVTKLASEHGCEVSQPRLEEAAHIERSATGSYGSTPPVSGEHFGRNAPWGVYDEPLPDEYAVHNLEHGGVVIWVGGGLKDTIRSLDALARDKVKIVVTPRPNFDGIAAGAWGKLLMCDGNAASGISDDELRDLMAEWVDTTLSTGAEGEAEIPPIIAGDPAADLPEPPKPVLDTTVEP